MLNFFLATRFSNIVENGLHYYKTSDVFTCVLMLYISKNHLKFNC